MGAGDLVQPSQHPPQPRRLPDSALPHLLEVDDGQVVVPGGAGDLGGGALGGFHLGQQAPLQADDVLGGAQIVLLPGQEGLLPQLGGEDGQPHRLRVVVDAHKELVLQPPPSVPSLPQQVGGGEDPGLATVEFPVEQGLVAVDVVDQPHRRGVDAHSVQGTVHAVGQGRLQPGQTQTAQGLGECVLLRQSFIPDQCGQRHWLAQVPLNGGAIEAVANGKTPLTV